MVLNACLLMSNFVKTKSFELAVYQRGNLDSKKFALVLPGRLDTKDYPHMKSHVDFLSKKGYLAISFDPPGTWETSDDIKQYTMTNYLKAINELIEYFGNKPTVLMGHSRGGTMAMLAGTRNSHVTYIITAMSRSNPNRISENARLKGFEISYRDKPTGGEKKFELPLSYFEDAAQYNPLEALSTCIKPKLFVAGKKDDVVPPDSVKKLFENAADPKEFYEIDCGHDYRKIPEKISEINQVMESFLEKFP